MAIGHRRLLGQRAGARSPVAVAREHRLSLADQRVRAVEQAWRQLVRLRLESRGPRSSRPAQDIGPNRVQFGLAILRFRARRSLFRPGAVPVLDPPPGIPGRLLGRFPILRGKIRGAGLERIGPGFQGATENGASQGLQFLGFVQRLECLVYPTADVVITGSVVVPLPGVGETRFRALEQAGSDQVHVGRTGLLDALRDLRDAGFDALCPERRWRQDGERDHDGAQARGCGHLESLRSFLSQPPP